MQSIKQLHENDAKFWRKAYLVTLVLGLALFVSGLTSPNILSKAFYILCGVLEIISSVIGLKKIKNPEDIIISSWLLFSVVVGFLLIVPAPAYWSPPINKAIAIISAIIIGCIGLYGILGIAKKYNLPVAP